MRLGHAAVLAGRLHGGRGLDRLAESLDRDARRRRDVLVAGARLASTGAACWACLIIGRLR